MAGEEARGADDQPVGHEQLLERSPHQPHHADREVRAVGWAALALLVGVGVGSEGKRVADVDALGRGEGGAHHDLVVGGRVDEPAGGDHGPVDGAQPLVVDGGEDQPLGIAVELAEDQRPRRQLLHLPLGGEITPVGMGLADLTGEDDGIRRVGPGLEAVQGGPRAEGAGHAAEDEATGEPGDDAQREEGAPSSPHIRAGPQHGGGEGPSHRCRTYDGPGPTGRGLSGVAPGVVASPEEARPHRPLGPAPSP